MSKTKPHVDSNAHVDPKATCPKGGEEHAFSGHKPDEPLMCPTYAIALEQSHVDPKV